MPRIDPIQLLKCLSVLLAPNGGIKSRDKVERLAGMMIKFSKKLVSKCIYIQILKNTERELLCEFMNAGGWKLIHIWMTESIAAKNWALAQELLELLLLCPVTVEIMKLNNCPKLVKELSKGDSHYAVKALATKLVEQWLKIVKGDPVDIITLDDIPAIILETKFAMVDNPPTPELKCDDNIPLSVVKKELSGETVENGMTHSDKINFTEESNDLENQGTAVQTSNNETDLKPEEINAGSEKENESLPILKITVKNGKQVVMKIQDDEEINGDKKRDKEYKSKTKSKESSTSKSSSSSKHSSSNRLHSSSKSSDKHKTSSSSSRSSSSSSKHKSKEKHRDKDDSRDKHRSGKERDRSSSYDKNRKRDVTKEQAEKNKETLDKLQSQAPSISKLGKIPKKSDPLKKETPSMSIEVRKPNDPNRPKTVKVFNSKMRSHGLEQEVVKPPPPRGAIVKKQPPPIPPTVSIPKRPSPTRSVDAPPEKKPKTVEAVEKPGAIKLIAPKPKPAYLLESDMFMDALTASATNKKEPRKRKRRISGSKDEKDKEVSPPSTPTVTSPEAKSTPFKFYKDTLENEDDKHKEESDKTEDLSPKEEENLYEERRDANGLKGVLCYHKKKGPKRSIRWKPDNELEQIQYFELDENERVNVTKTFMDMKHLDRISEREAFQKARNLSNDVMEERTTWRAMIPIDINAAVVEYGKNSKEKEIQAARQKSILQSIYFHKSMIPDSPGEPDPEVHPYTDAAVIPLDDVTGNPDSVNDYRNTPWPEPKEESAAPPPVMSNNINMPQIFPPPMAGFPATFPQSGQFPFQGPGAGMGPPDWSSNMAPAMLPSIMGPGNMIGPGVMPPMMPNGMMMPPEGMMPPGQMFPGPPMPPDAFNMMDNGGNMFGFSGPPGPERAGFNYNNRGGMRGRGNTWRGKWDGPPRGRGGGPPRGGVGGGRGNRSVCIHFQKKGSCRSGDQCAFLHPGVNCPY